MQRESNIDILISFKDISIEKYTENYFELHDKFRPFAIGNRYRYNLLSIAGMSQMPIYYRQQQIGTRRVDFPGADFKSVSELEPSTGLEQNNKQFYNSIYNRIE
jgi:hypothetical protein